MLRVVFEYAGYKFFAVDGGGNATTEALRSRCVAAAPVAARLAGERPQANTAIEIVQIRASRGITVNRFAKRDP